MIHYISFKLTNVQQNPKDGKELIPSLENLTKQKQLINVMDTSNSFRYWRVYFRIHTRVSRTEKDLWHSLAVRFGIALDFTTF